MVGLGCLGDQDRELRVGAMGTTMTLWTVFVMRDQLERALHVEFNKLGTAERDPLSRHSLLGIAASTFSR
jgi:hypothetical protein